MTRYKEIGPYKMAYNDNMKKKPPMVFVHGLPTGKELFSPLAEMFDKDYRTIAVDLLDYGESDRTGRPMEHKERAANLKQLLEELDLDEITLVCHDLGSSVAMDFMGLCPDKVKRLIIMSPPVYPDFTEPAVVKIVRSTPAGPILIALARNLLLKRSLEKGLYHKEAYDIYLRKSLESAFSGKSGGRALFRNLNWGRPSRVFADYPAIMKSISCPVLILQGRKDPFIPVGHTERLREDIKGAKLVLFEDAGHFLPIDIPRKLYIEIAHFIEE